MNWPAIITGVTMTIITTAILKGGPWLLSFQARAEARQLAEFVGMRRAVIRARFRVIPLLGVTRV